VEAYEGRFSPPKSFVDRVLDETIQKLENNEDFDSDTVLKIRFLIENQEIKNLEKIKEMYMVTSSV